MKNNQKFNLASVDKLEALMIASEIPDDKLKALSITFGVPSEVLKKATARKDDLYSIIAEYTGLDRKQVKCIAFGASYSAEDKRER